MNNECPLPFAGGEGEGWEGSSQMTDSGWWAEGWRTEMASGQ